MSRKNGRTKPSYLLAAPLNSDTQNSRGATSQKANPAEISASIAQAAIVLRYQFAYKSLTDICCANRSGRSIRSNMALTTDFLFTCRILRKHIWASVAVIVALVL